MMLITLITIVRWWQCALLSTESIWMLTFIGWSFIGMILLTTIVITNYWSFVGMTSIQTSLLVWICSNYYQYNSNLQRSKSPYVNDMIWYNATVIYYIHLSVCLKWLLPIIGALLVWLRFKHLYWCLNSDKIAINSITVAIIIKTIKR